MGELGQGKNAGGRWPEPVVLIPHLGGERKHLGFQGLVPVHPVVGVAVHRVENLLRPPVAVSGHLPHGVRDPDEHPVVGGGGVLVRPRVEVELVVGVVVVRRLEVVQRAEVTEHLGLGLRERRGPAVGGAPRVGRRSAVVVSPFVAEVPVQIHAVEAVDDRVAVVVPKILAPEPERSGTFPGVLVADVAIRVDHGDEPGLAMIDDVRELRIDPVVVDEGEQEVQDRLHPPRFARMGERGEKHLRAGSQGLHVRGHGQSEDRPTLEAGSDGVHVGDDSEGVRGGQRVRSA